LPRHYTHRELLELIWNAFREDGRELMGFLSDVADSADKHFGKRSRRSIEYRSTISSTEVERRRGPVDRRDDVVDRVAEVTGIPRDVAEERFRRFHAPREDDDGWEGLPNSDPFRR
jgi:hypothetical protein